MLSDSCLSCLSVTLVYCGQTVGWIKMKPGMKVGLRHGHIVLEGDPALPKNGTTPNFWPMSIVAKWLDASGGRPRPRRHCVRWGPSSPKRGTVPNVWPMYNVAKRSPISATAQLLCCVQFSFFSINYQAKRLDEKKVSETSGYATMVHGRGCNPHRCMTTFANLEITSL